jgi:DNA-binding response OmpR family regulator
MRDWALRVLIIENDKPVRRALKRGLEEQGFAVDVAHDAGAGDGKARRAAYDVIVLNLMSPDDVGLSLLRKWRQAGIGADVFVLTPRSRVEDEVRCLELGADHYLTVPFEPEEFFARLRALMRRRRPAEEYVLRVHDLEIDTAARAVKRGGRAIELTRREFALLEFLARHPGRVLSRTMIRDSLYDGQGTGASNLVDVYIRYLRNKIDKGFDTPLILTRWGQGYLLRGSA